MTTPEEWFMAETQSNYVSFMLRLWQVSSAGQPVWRASLENTSTGERHGFANPASLLEFLSQVTQTQTERRSGSPDARSPPQQQS
jgi:hypothetical protein